MNFYSWTFKWLIHSTNLPIYQLVDWILIQLININFRLKKLQIGTALWAIADCLGGRNTYHHNFVPPPPFRSSITCARNWYLMVEQVNENYTPLDHQSLPSSVEKHDFCPEGLICAPIFSSINESQRHLFPAFLLEPSMLTGSLRYTYINGHVTKINHLNLIKFLRKYAKKWKFTYTQKDIFSYVIHYIHFESFYII